MRSQNHIDAGYMLCSLVVLLTIQLKGEGHSIASDNGGQNNIGIIIPYNVSRATLVLSLICWFYALNIYRVVPDSFQNSLENKLRKI